MKAKYIIWVSFIILCISYYITEYTHFTHTPRVLSRTHKPPLKKQDNLLSRKIIGSDDFKAIDPFYIYNHYKLKKGEGLFDHPHCGYDTVTYILKGELQYEDFHNNSGVLKPGDCQWISSGKGIVHAEVAGSDTEFLQFFLALPMDYKLSELYVQTLMNEDIVTATSEGVVSKVISGETLSRVSYTINRNPAYVIDTIMLNNSVWLTDIPEGWNAILYVLAGEIEVQGDRLGLLEAAMLSQWDTDLEVRCLDKCRVFLIAAMPMEEMVVAYKQFYMPNYPMIEKASRDFNEGKNGFEGSVGWKSRLSKVYSS